MIITYIYQIHEYGGDWENRFNNIVGTYLDYEQAFERKIELEDAECYRQEFLKYCAETQCNVSCNKYEDDGDGECMYRHVGYEKVYFKICKVRVIE